MFNFLSSGIFCQLNSIQKPNTQFYIRDAYTCLCGIGGNPGRSIAPSPPGITPEAPLSRTVGNILIHLWATAQIMLFGEGNSRYKDEKEASQRCIVQRVAIVGNWNWIALGHLAIKHTHASDLDHPLSPISLWDTQRMQALGISSLPYLGDQKELQARSNTSWQMQLVSVEGIRDRHHQGLLQWLKN